MTRKRFSPPQPLRLESPNSTPRFNLGNLLRLLVLLAFGVFFLVPLIWFILAPAKTNEQLIFSGALTLGTLEQFKQSWNNLTSYNDGRIFLWARNSLIYVLGGLLLSVAVCIPAGYILATKEFAGRRTILILTLIALILPGSATVLPLFLEINAMGLRNTMLGVILPTGFFPFGVYLAYIFFSTTIPKSLYDAGRVDGCNEWQLFSRIALPLSLPVTALIAFFGFVGNWNNYFFPFLILSDDRLYNLPVGLAVLISGTAALNPANVGGLTQIQRPEVALAGLFVVLPIALVFLFSQRFVRSGMLSGAEKS